MKKTFLVSGIVVAVVLVGFTASVALPSELNHVTKARGTHTPSSIESKDPLRDKSQNTLTEDDFTKERENSEASDENGNEIIPNDSGSQNSEPTTPQSGGSKNDGHPPKVPVEPHPITDPPASQPPAQPAPPVPACPSSPGGGGSAPGVTSAGGVAGTTTDDIVSFAAKFNEIRVANCLQPISPSNFRYDSCMETRLFWMAEDPSEDPMSAWGHIGSQRSDGVPSVGCDGNLAGGNGNTGATVAQKWWDSTSHRASLYRPTAGSVAGVCIYFAMTHGGIPNEPYSFTRAAARWGSC